MTRRERHIAILHRIGSPLGGIGYECATDQDIESLTRNALWWNGLAKHNARVFMGWMKADWERFQAERAAQVSA